jgi:hypothetical protein
MMFDSQWPHSQSASASSSSNLPRGGLLLAEVPESLETAAPPPNSLPYSLRQILLSSNNVHDFSTLLDANKASVSCSHLANVLPFNYCAGHDYAQQLAPTRHTP